MRSLPFILTLFFCGLADAHTGSLTEALDAKRAQANQSGKSEFRTLTAQALKEITETGIVEQAKQVGDQAPLFALSDATGKTVELANLLNEGPTILVFYRGQWCPYCNLTLHAYEEHLEQIKALGATLVAISPEKPDNALTLIEKNNLSFPVLTDENNAYARELGIVFEMPAALRDAYLNYGIPLVKKAGTENTYELPLSATYIIDREGVIHYAYLNVDYTHRADPLEVIAALEKL